MHCSCVRHTDLPHTSALFADVLYHPDRTAAFYHHPLREFEDFQKAAAEIRFPAERRAALVAALRERNPDGPALQMLAQPETVAVVTGQQVGLFSGPSYTLYKVLHAIKLAEWLTGRGIPAVPVFWLATEDHVFAEVNHAWIFDRMYTPIKLEMRRAASAQPVGGVALANPPLREFRAALHGMPFGEEVADLVEETYRAGNTMGQAFSELLRRLLARFDVPQVDPMLPVFRELAAPALAAAVEQGAELTQRVLKRNQQLAAAGYHTQVHVEEQTSFFFLLENGKRLALRRVGEEYILNGRRFSVGELAARAASLSPNALLRPVVQDFMLPTVAYIGGPAELAYLAQSDVLYRALLGRRPVAVHRSGFTVLDRRSRKLLDRYGLCLPDFFHGEAALRERVAAALVPPGLTGVLEETRSAVGQNVQRLEGELARFDPTLDTAVRRSYNKIAYQLSKIERKVGREMLARDERATRDASYINGLIYPNKHLQERFYSIVPLLAKHGPELIGQLYEGIHLECPDHQMLVV